MATHGVIVVDKPAGWTSHDVVAKIRKIYHQRRVGHAGTLDPDATGVLLVGLGRATRLLRFLHDQADIEAVVPAFLGEIEQLPPMVSAVKVGGRRLHELARRGEEVERAPRRVRVDRIDIEAFEPGPYPAATVLVECSSGTYVRSLAADIGGRLGGVAHLGELRRLHIGSFTLDEARTLADIEADADTAVLPPVTAMRDLEQVSIDAEQARAVAHGVTFPASVFAGANAGPGPFAVVGPDGELLAVYERRRAAVKPAVVLAPVEAT